MPPAATYGVKQDDRGVDRKDLDGDRVQSMTTRSTPSTVFDTRSNWLTIAPFSTRQGVPSGCGAGEVEQLTPKTAAREYMSSTVWGAPTVVQSLKTAPKCASEVKQQHGHVLLPKVATTLWTASSPETTLLGLHTIGECRAVDDE